MSVTHLPVTRSLATVDVVGLAGADRYRRALAYVGNGTITIESATAGALTATVVGTAPYRVRVGFRGAGLEHECSCPSAEDGSFCKHLVAVVVEVTTAGGRAWAEVLDRLCDQASAGLAADAHRSPGSASALGTRLDDLRREVADTTCRRSVTPGRGTREISQLASCDLQARSPTLAP